MQGGACLGSGSQDGSVDVLVEIPRGSRQKYELDQKTGRWQMWDMPIRGSQPYETSVDRDGNIWFPDTWQPDRPRSLQISRRGL